jgi:hypothetical protein
LNLPYGAVKVRSPGFEPGLSGWEPDVLTKLDYNRSFFYLGLFIFGLARYIGSSLEYVYCYFYEF